MEQPFLVALKYYFLEPPIAETNVWKNTGTWTVLLKKNNSETHISSKFRSSRRKVFCKKAIIITFSKFSVKHLLSKRVLSTSAFSKNLKKKLRKFFYKTPPGCFCSSGTNRSQNRIVKEKD